MNITGKTLMINVEHNLTIGTNDAITLDVIHQVCLYENKDGSIGCDIDLIDFDNIKFLGISIENGYMGFRDFKDQMLKFGINVEELIDEKCVGIITNKDIIELKSMFK